MNVEDFSMKNYVSVESIGLFSRDNADYIDVWMIKITSKQIKSKCMFASFKSRLHAKTMFDPKAWFSLVLRIVRIGDSYAWFSLDRNAVLKSHYQNRFWFAANVSVTI